MNCKYCDKKLRNDNKRGICHKCWPSTNECKLYLSNYVKANKEKHNASGRAYKERNRELVRKAGRDRYYKKKDQILPKQKLYYQLNKEERSQYQKDNREKINKRLSYRRKNDIEYKLSCILRDRIAQAVKYFKGKIKKPASAVDDLGCTLEELKLYLESKWLPGMSWDNHSVKGWHIDHIKCLSSFKLEIYEEFIQACHYTNLQPLWAKENLSKNGVRRKTINPKSDQQVVSKAA